MFLRVTLSLLVLTLCSVRGEDHLNEQNPEDLSRQQFQAVASRLDVGGDLFFVGNVDGLFEQFVDELLSGAPALPPDTREEQSVKASLDRLRVFLKESGLFAIRGVGASVVPRGDGDHSVKLFIQRDYLDSDLPFWRGFVGWQPRRLACLDFLPPDTAFVHAATLEIESLWGLLTGAVNRVAPKGAEAAFDAKVASLQNTLGMGIGQILNSLNSEFFLSIQLSRDKQTVFPTAGGFVTTPEPSFLVGAAVKDELLRGLFEIQLAKAGQTVVEKRVGDSIMRFVDRPVPAPMNLQPAYASHAGFFILGSSPAVIEKALVSYDHKSGLLSRRDFKRAFRGLTMVNNGITYVSPEMGSTIADIRIAHLEAMRNPMPQHPAYDRIVSRLTHRGADASCAYVIQNWKSGIMIAGNSSKGGKDVMAALAATPMSLLTTFLTQNNDKKLKDR